MVAKFCNSWYGVALVMALLATGCTTYNGGQVTPGWYNDDEVVYHAPGGEYKLAREAAALKAYNATQQDNDSPPESGH